MAFEPFSRPVGVDWATADRTYGQVKFGDDSQQVVLFYVKSVFDAAASAAKGSRQYKNENWVRMCPPGEKLNIVDRPVKEEDTHRFPRQWNAFLQNKTQVPEGTPIDLLFPNNPAIADNLKAFGVFTIQQCANLSAHALDSIGMGSQNWKNMAVQYLESAKSGSAFLQMRTEMDKKDQQIRLLTQQNAMIKAQLDDITNRLKDPTTNVYQPNWQEGHDAQAARLNANHPSQQIRPSKAAPPQHELDQANLIQQVTEESFPVVDVTQDQEQEQAAEEPQQEEAQEYVPPSTRKKR